MPSASSDVSAKCCMEAQKESCAFCADSDTQSRRRNFSAILRCGGPLCTFLRTIWPACGGSYQPVCRRASTTFRRSVKQTQFPLPIGNETNMYFPCRNTVITSTWLMESPSYPASLPTSSITLHKHCGSTKNPNKGTFIVLHTRTEVHACDYM